MGQEEIDVSLQVHSTLLDSHQQCLYFLHNYETRTLPRFSAATTHVEHAHTLNCGATRQFKQVNLKDKEHEELQQEYSMATVLPNK